MTGMLVAADDGQGASVVVGAVYDDAAIGKLRRDVDEYGWTSRGVTPHWTRADFNAGQSGRCDPPRASSRALG